MLVRILNNYFQEPLRIIRQIAIKEGDVIREGYNEKLDELRYIARNGKDWIAQLRAKRTGNNRH